MNTPTRTTIAESPQSNMEYIGQTVMGQMRCATFAKVTAVDTKYKTINCLPLVNDKIRANNAAGYTYVGLPELLNVPYYTGGPTPEVNDLCVCIHLDRNINGIIAQAKEVIDRAAAKLDFSDVSNINCNSNKHNLGDCVAFVGFLK